MGYQDEAGAHFSDYIIKVTTIERRLFAFTWKRQHIRKVALIADRPGGPQCDEFRIVVLDEALLPELKTLAEKFQQEGFGIPVKIVR